MSDPIATFLNSAEISGTLLGTVAIVSVFRGQTRWMPEGRFWVMVVLASSTFGLAMLPIPFIAADAPANLTWGVPSVATLLAVAGVTRVSLWGMRIQEDLGIETHRPTLAGFLILLATAVAMALWNIGLLPNPTFWRHLTAVMALQAATVLFFVRLLRLWLIDSRDEDA